MIVQDDALSVPRELRIQLDQVIALIAGRAKGGKGVFGVFSAHAAVGLEQD